MKVEIRNDVVIIEGYVNAVERDSKVLRNAKGPFIEKMKAGVFQRALERAKKTGYDVKVLLNHNYDKELTSTKDSTTLLTEDAIGLKCRCEIRDKEVIEKAKLGKLVGWSFGFLCLKEDEKAGENNIRHRDVREIDLKEVSVLDDTKIPAYNGTSIETRNDNMDEFYEIRMSNDEVEILDNTNNKEPPLFDNYQWENRYLATRAF